MQINKMNEGSRQLYYHHFFIIFSLNGIFHYLFFNNNQIKTSDLMFSCCCPSQDAEYHEEIQQIKQKLLKPQDKIDSSSIEGLQLIDKKESINLEQQKELPINQKIQSMNAMNFMRGTKSELQRQNEYNQQNREQKNVSGKILYKMSIQDGEKTKKKNDLWLQQTGTKIVYECINKQQEMVFTYRISHIHNQDINPLNYIINQKNKQKSKDLITILALFNKTQSQLRSYLKTFQMQPKNKLICGISKEEQQLKTKLYGQKHEINEIVMMNNISLRLEIFNMIIIDCLNQKNFQQILMYCEKLTNKYQLDELEKIIFILPAEITLKEIQMLLTKIFRRFLISQKIQTILKFLGYHIELTKNVQNEYIIIRNNFLMCEPEQIISKQFQIKLQLAIGLLMIEIKENNFQAYQKLLQNLFVDMTIIKYLRTTLFIHKDQKFSISKLEELKIVEKKHLMEIQNSARIQERKINANEKCIIIRHKIKKRMGEFFKEYKWSQTPIEQSSKKQRQWDDQLKINDIKAAIHQKPMQMSLDENYNIFEVIPQGQLADTPLDIIYDIQIRDD